MTQTEFKYSKWVFTLTPEVSGQIPSTAVSEFLKAISETYAFQLELGEAKGREHYQGVLKTPYRVRQQTLLRKFKEGFEPLWPEVAIQLDRMQGDWATALAYSTKTETRIDGPWFSDDIGVPYEGDDVNFLANEDSRYPWQKELLKLLLSDDESTFKDPDDREIIWVSDTVGCSGKSKLVKYMFINYPSVTEVSFGSSNQLRTALISIGPKKCYFIDMPRQLGDEDSIATLVSVLEKLKGGFITSTMYGKFTSLVMSPPHIVIFSNTIPPVKMLSMDRWKIFTILSKELYDTKVSDTGSPLFVPIGNRHYEVD
jgi:hypothetical protein